MFSSFSGSLCAFSKGVEQNVRVALVEEADSWFGLTEHVSDGSFIERNNDGSFVGLDPGIDAVISFFIGGGLIKRSEDFDASFGFSDLSNIVS